MAKISRILLVLGVIMTIFTLSAHAQASNFLKPVRVAGGSFVSINDSLVYFQNDTVIYISDTYMPQDTSVYKRTLIFYDSLKAKAGRKNLTKLLYDLVVIPPARPGSQKINENNEDQYLDHSGKVIRNIYIKRLNAFGSSIINPESSLENESENFLNRTHIKTREYVIRNYLLLEEKDSLFPYSISESERLLRQLPFIYDARIFIIPVSDDEVDLMVITKDVYSLGLMADIRSIDVGKVSVIDKNLLGLGHEFEIEIPYNYSEYSSIGFGAAYTLKNISQTMVDVKLEYKNAFKRKLAGFNVSRKFFTPYTKYAGGLSVYEVYIMEDLDTLTIPEPVEFNNFDIWLGRSFLLDDNHTRVVFAGRYVNNNVWSRPEISSNSYYQYQKYKLYLASFSLVSQRFYKSNLIYNYGRSEDIPYGGILELSYGKEFNEFDRRDYLQVNAAFGNFVPNAGYFYWKGLLSTFIKDNTTEQGLLNLNFRYISDLHNLKSYKLRFFATLDYTRGFKRFNDESLVIGDDYGIRGFKNDSLFPDQRLYLNLETVAFSKAFIYGFRFAFFGFADVVLFSKDRIFESDRMVSGFGVGLRIRNESLIFNTFQIRFGIYPGAPPNSIMRNIHIEGERLLNPPGFDPGPPGISKFR
ncbi:MAG: hypothetical protein V2I34_11005 [Bacteroidales bacterium]|jgi:hypothetical protein|nr:hypothetical protein [Bacteroidales bacterium]